jgi:hypothetical protein
MGFDVTLEVHRYVPSAGVARSAPPSRRCRAANRATQISACRQQLLEIVSPADFKTVDMPPATDKVRPVMPWK